MGRPALPVGVKSFFSGKHKWAVAVQYYRCAGGAWVKAPTYSNKPNQRHWIFMEVWHSLWVYFFLEALQAQNACTLC